MNTMTDLSIDRVCELARETFAALEETRNCKSCNGLKVASWDPARECFSCRGRGVFSRPTPGTLLDAVAGRPKAGRWTVRSKSPEDPRAGYVWRLARFHGGVDVTMPMSAGIRINGDPYEPELHALAEACAVLAFGSHYRGAARWAGLL